MNYLIRYFREQESIFLQQLSLIKQRPGKKAVHALRVAFKKWRTVLRFADLVNNRDNAAEEMEALRYFFRIAGIYRDAEMSESLFKQYIRKEKCRLPSFHQYLRALCRITGHQTHSAAQADMNTWFLSIANRITPLLSAFPEEELNNQVQSYAGKKWDACLELRDQFTKQAHALRKELKQIYYLLLLCPVNILFDPGQMKQLDRALDALGNWHDHELLYQRLRYFRKHYLVKGMDEYEQACKMETLLDLEREGWLSMAEEGLKKI